MAKTKKNKNKKGVTVKDLVGVELRGLLESAKEYMLHYGALTVENRALPDFRDGCKPVHRRILYAAYNTGRHHDKPFVKSAKMVGECFGAGTLISTPKGKVAIENLEVGDTVNTSKGDFKVTNTFENPPAEASIITFEDGRQLILTNEQELKVKTKDGFKWKKACELTEDDLIVSEI
jgi:Type IIA topoisomerase (DNA gyrase/topo II, topoisomerase IV), A subunit